MPNTGFDHLEDMRFDLQVIGSWIAPNARVLDLGCGNGDLLHYLKRFKSVRGTGIEQSEEKVSRCIARGLNVLQGDFKEEVADYPDQCFDFVILSQTLQQVMNPKALILELLRIGQSVIVSFPNFSHYAVRLQLLWQGCAPRTDQLPYDWYDSPNIRVITINDFKRFLKTIDVEPVKVVAINSHHHDTQGNIIHFFPNIRATYGIIMLKRAG